MADMERAKMMKKVQAYMFAMSDAALFLDSHPNNKQALDYYRKYQKLSADAQAEFTKKYGPMTMDTVSPDAPMWNWIDGPWPWQMED